MSTTTASCPVKECDEVVDVIIRSSDGKLFGCHSHRLALYSPGFPPYSPDGDTAVELPEQGDAAEKYGVYSAIEISKLRMRLAVSTQPLEVLRYAVRHDYHTLPASPNHAVKVFDYGRLYSAWTSYRDQFARVYNSITSSRPEPNQHSGGSRKCTIWNRYVNDVQKEASRRRRSDLTNVDSFEGTMHEIGEGRFDDCSCNDAAIGRWWKQVRLNYSEDFSYFYSRQA
ncbi:hypothetical protein BDZ89DRAFT_1070444 [Hymenopellis radicata]|nr:hypothetical protein BDZ89DRAFT_1070444 [Hymenopellis radicata]